MAFEKGAAQSFSRTMYAGGVITAPTGDLSATISKDGGAPESIGGTVLHVGSAIVEIALFADDMDCDYATVIVNDDAATAEDLELSFVTEAAYTAVRAAHLTGDVRTLTVAERSSIASAVWAYGTRTLTSFGTLIASIWAYATRTLTGGSVSIVGTSSTRLQGRLTQSVHRELNSYPPIIITLERGGEAVDVSEADHISLTLYDPSADTILVDHEAMEFVDDGTDGQVQYQLTDAVLTDASAAAHDIQLEVFWTSQQSESASITTRVDIAEHVGTHS